MILRSGRKEEEEGAISLPGWYPDSSVPLNFPGQSALFVDFEEVDFDFLFL